MRVLIYLSHKLSVYYAKYNTASYSFKPYTTRWSKCYTVRDYKLWNVLKLYRVVVSEKLNTCQRFSRKHFQLIFYISFTASNTSFLLMQKLIQHKNARSTMYPDRYSRTKHLKDISFNFRNTFGIWVCGCGIVKSFLLIIIKQQPMSLGVIK